MSRYRLTVAEQIVGLKATLRSLARDATVGGLWARSGARGRRTGRLRKIVDGAKIARLRARGNSWRTIADQLGVPVATAYNVAQGRSKNAVQANSADS